MKIRARSFLLSVENINEDILSIAVFGEKCAVFNVALADGLMRLEFKKKWNDGT